MDYIATELQKKLETELKDMEKRVNKRMDQMSDPRLATFFLVVYAGDAVLFILVISLSEGGRRCSRHIINWCCRMFRQRVQPVAD